MINLLVIYGEGGHESEASNFIEEMNLIASDIRMYTCSSSYKVDFRINEIRDKYNNFSLIKGLIGNIRSLSRLFKFYRKSNITHIVSLGPGISIVPLLLSKFFKIKTAHIETSCRFESKSISGRLIYYIVDSFYVQNKELLYLYKNAVFVGRL